LAVAPKGAIRMSGMIGWFLTGGLVGGGASGAIGYTIGQARGLGQNRSEVMKSYRQGVKDGEEQQLAKVRAAYKNKYHPVNHGREDHICTSTCGGGR
jgi:hypothetical protein